MKCWSWAALVDLRAEEAQQEQPQVDVRVNCSGSCLRTMGRVLDAGPLQQALLEAQVAMASVTGAVVLSAYQWVPERGVLQLLATGHDPDETLRRVEVSIAQGSMLSAVLADGLVRWVAADEGEVAAAGAAALHRGGHVDGVLVAEFLRGGAGTGRGSAACLACVASVMSVALARNDVEEAQRNLLTLERYRSVAELSVQVTHDFNNMMQAVLGNAALAKMDAPQGGPMAESLAAIETAASKAAALARKLLNFARDSRATGSCDAVAAASDALDLAGTLYLRGVEVTKDLPSSPIAVSVTGNDLENALILVTKASVLRLKPVASAHLTVAEGPGPRQARVTLEVQGVRQAMAAEETVLADRLAAAAVAVMNAAGGLLELRTGPGTEAAVVTLAREPVVQPAAPREPSETVGMGGLPVTIVGGSGALGMLLTAADCSVKTVPSWQDVEREAPGGTPRIVMAAVHDAAGIEVAIQGRQRLGVPVVIICAQGVHCTPEEAAALDGVLGLPLDLDDVRAMLKRLA
ncbi:MAG TPA: hypothetical protein PLZ61_05220 [Candidatus Cryosericum sp.]|nr:hypothetical protein [Candidatus Cryosericum sp.]